MLTQGAHLIHKQHVCILVPAILICFQGQVLLDVVPAPFLAFQSLISDCIHKRAAAGAVGERTVHSLHKP